MPAPRRTRARQQPAPPPAAADHRPDSVRSRLTLSEGTVLKTVAKLYDAPARRKRVTTVEQPDLPISALETEDLRVWALSESGNDPSRVEVHSPRSVTVHNSAAMKARRRQQRADRLKTA